MDKKELSLAELAKQCLEDSERWFGDKENIKYSIPYYTLCMAGELGEFANIIKKIERGSLSFAEAKVRYDLAMELTDVLIYLLNVAALLKLDLYKSYDLKRIQNEKRFMEERKKRND